MKVLLLEKIDESGMELLRKSGFQIDLAAGVSEEDLLKIVGDYDAILVRAMIPLTENIIRAAKKCRIISRHGVGLDTIDVAAATRAHIPVAYTPGANANAVAEHTIGLILDVMKQNCLLSHRLMKDHDYRCRLNVCNSELRGKVLGIVGMGNIGMKVAQIANWGFGAKIIAWGSRNPQQRFEQMQVEGRLARDMDDLLQNSDIVSLHLPGTETELMNERTFGKMKKGSILINTARGSLVNEAELYRALVDGQLAGAGLDVLACEPPDADNPLFTLENVVITPHTAALTAEGKRNMAVGAAEQIVNYLLHGEKPWGFANPDVWLHRRL